MADVSTMSGPQSTRHYTRPGVEAAARLLSFEPITNDVVQKWSNALNNYPAMLAGKKGDKLVSLDKKMDTIASLWQRPLGVNSKADEPALTKAQLIDIIIEWKFLKGKPRNALKPLLNANSDTTINECSRRAFRIAKAIRQCGPSHENWDESNTSMSMAISELCKLKGIGPATASAILGMYRPDIFAFMDDEVIESLYNGKRGYTLKIYLDINGRCRELAEQLGRKRNRFSNDVGDDVKWTPYKVGQALWTVATASATKNEELLSEIFEDDGSKLIQSRTITEDTNLEGKQGTKGASTTRRKRRKL
mmetsp:Transcript_8072/g.15466  ORF Transcript_8072/g.15466 Transcript_8072/m.15466 type:complete len:306 (+) Transcript_8072:94-1011(+)